MVEYWPTTVLLGDRQLRLDPRKGAGEMATTSKEGRRYINHLDLAVGTRTKLNSLTEDQLEDKSGASSHGNTSSNNAYENDRS